jgi:hypothetical protein
MIVIQPKNVKTINGSFGTSFLAIYFSCQAFRANYVLHLTNNSSCDLKSDRLLSEKKDCILTHRHFSTPGTGDDLVSHLALIIVAVRRNADLIVELPKDAGGFVYSACQVPIQLRIP